MSSLSIKYSMHDLICDDNILCVNRDRSCDVGQIDVSTASCIGSSL